MSEQVVPVVWQGDCLEVLDQRRLPGEEVWHSYRDSAGVCGAIASMQVRGAPAIGIAAAYGVVLAALEARGDVDWHGSIERAADELADSRPTAVNLFWALKRMRGCLEGVESGAEACRLLEAEALRIHEEDAAANRRMGALGADVIQAGSYGAVEVLTHCNTGALATGGHGTALGVVRTLRERGVLSMVHMDETRPWLQGSRLTAWECLREGIPCSLNADGAAATLLASGRVRWVIVGADRIVANGDVANKIGTLNLAVLARHYGVGMMVVAPTSTLDRETPDGSGIVIEERDGDELRHFGERQVAPEGVAAFNPVFDVTPAALVNVIVTEKGVIRDPSGQASPLASLV